MPCTYYTPEEEAAMSDKEAADAKAELKKALTSLNRVTAMLCDVLGRWEAADGKGFDVSVSTSAWWMAHKKKDARERAAKARKTTAKAKTKRGAT